MSLTKNPITHDVCTYFNHGQKLTPDHLNAINDFTLRRSAMLSRLLVGAKGVIQNIGSEFAVNLLDDDPLTIRIASGAAINEFGQILQLDETRLLSLRDMIAGEVTQLFIQIVPKESLESPYQDSEIPEMRGYQFRRIGVTLSVTKELDPKGIEIARIKLSSRTRSLVLSDRNMLPEAEEGVVDTRHALKVKIYSANQVPFEEHFSIQSAVSHFRSTLFQLNAIFTQLKTMPRLLHSSMILESEVSETVFAFAKINYLLREIQRALLDNLEEVREFMHKDRKEAKGFWPELFEQASKIASDGPTASVLNFRQLHQVTLKIRENILDATSEEERKILIRESLYDLRNRNFGYQPKHVFGGILYKLAENFEAEALKGIVRSKVEFETIKTLTAKYSEGQNFSAKGLFYSEGRLEFKLSNLKGGIDTILLFRLYKRRGQEEFSITVNGTVISVEKLLAHEHIDEFINIGLLLEGDRIVSGDNQIGIEIQRADLDFGLFGVWAYQVQEVNEL